jgi:hypothetical protein
MGDGLHRQSKVLVQRLEQSGQAIVFGWAVLAGLACSVRLAVSPLSEWSIGTQLVNLLPYLLVVAAPIVSLWLALHWFPKQHRFPQPEFRLSRYGQWRSVSDDVARSYPLYGVAGILVSLLIGLLLNVPVRVLEFLAAIPTVGEAPPDWFGSLYAWMLADTVLLSSLYVVAFVAALRRVPLFPRLLVLVWSIDICMQTLIAQSMGAVEGLPLGVATSLQSLLTNNLYKALIGVGIWLPYLLLSRRVNATYRHRLPARVADACLSR